MSGQIVDLGFGKANTSNTIASFAAMKAAEPFTRVTAVGSGKRIKGSDHSLPFGRLDMNGSLVNMKVEHENGTILLMQVSWKRNGTPIRDAALFIRLRHGAPLYAVHAKLPLGRENQVGESFQMFQGCGDILNAAELQVAGLVIPRNYASNFMIVEELKECFVIRKLRDETQAKPTLTAIATSEGVKLREIPSEAPRRLRVRRG